MIRFLILTGVAFLFPLSIIAQLPKLEGKTVGIYLSGKNVAFTDEYYMAISRFLKSGEDRSQGENIKTEFLVRLGEELRLELQIKTDADSVYFINSDIERGSAFLEAYDPLSNRLDLQSPLFRETDFILVINELDLNVHYIKSMVIRSNRMIPERTMVKKAHLKISWFAIGKLASLFETESCFDEKKNKNVPPILNLQNGESPLGSFLSRVFSAWWFQSMEGITNSCEN